MTNETINRFNINDHVTVKLTEYGARKYNDYFLYRTNIDPGFLTMPIWELMQVFGPIMFHGMPKMPFVDNIFEIRKMCQ